MMNEPVSSIMTTSPKSLTPDDTLDDARKIFMDEFLGMIKGKKAISFQYAKRKDDDG